MNACALPMLPDTTLNDLKPFSAAALRHLPTVSALMDLEPAPELSQFSKDQPVQRVGTHRVAVAELMAQLLRADCPAVVAEVGATGLLERCVRLALDRPSCSPLQCATLRGLRVVVSPQCGHLGLWRPLLDSNIPDMVAAIATGAQGVSIGLRPPHAGYAIAVGDVLFTAATGKRLGKVPEGAEGSSKKWPFGKPSSSEGDETKEEESSTAAGEGETGESSSTSQAAAQAGTSTEAAAAGAGASLLSEGEAPSSSLMGPGTPPGSTKRDISPSSLEPWQTELAEALAGSSSWITFIEEEGPLDSLLTAQQMELAGPRPLRMNFQSDMDAELAALGGAGQMISGQELLALLRGLSFGRMG